MCQHRFQEIFYAVRGIHIARTQFCLQEITRQAIESHQGVIAVCPVVGIKFAAFLLAERIGMGGVQVDNELRCVPFHVHFIDQRLIQGLELGNGRFADPVPEPGK